MTKVEALRRSFLESGNQVGQVDHAGLWLDRWVKKWGDNNEAKKEAIRNVTSAAVPEIYKAAFLRWMDTFNNKDRFTLSLVKAKSRVAVGLGAASVLETNLTIHKTYGVPVIPGSALKGLASHFCKKYYNDFKVTVNKNEKGEDVEVSFYENVFGKQDMAGGIVFHDAWFIYGSAYNKPFMRDVMTVHHSKYYSGKKEKESDEDIAPPADWDSPNPIPYVDVIPKSCFLIAVEGANGWRELTCKILLEALEKWGIGAKTSSGYGRMEICHAETI